jgi:hypothetical protein
MAKARLKVMMESFVRSATFRNSCNFFSLECVRFHVLRLDILGRLVMQILCICGGTVSYVQMPAEWWLLSIDASELLLMFVTLSSDSLKNFFLVPSIRVSPTFIESAPDAPAGFSLHSVTIHSIGLTQQAPPPYDTLNKGLPPHS